MGQNALCEVYARGRRHCRGKRVKRTLWAQVGVGKRRVRRGRVKIDRRREEEAGRPYPTREKRQARVIEVVYSGGAFCLCERIKTRAGRNERVQGHEGNRGEDARGRLTYEQNQRNLKAKAARLMYELHHQRISTSA